jgi:hypothetical protein
MNLVVAFWNEMILTECIDEHDKNSITHFTVLATAKL